MGIRPFTESQTSAVLLTGSTRWSDAHYLENQEEPSRTRHRTLNIPAGELGLDLGPSDYTAAAWDTPHETAATMDSDEDSLTLHDDTVYDNAYDTDDNVYDVYDVYGVYDVYDVHEEMDVDYGDRPLRARMGPGLMGYDPSRINRNPTGHGRISSLGNSHCPCPCLVVIKQNLFFF